MLLYLFACVILSSNTLIIPHAESQHDMGEKLCDIINKEFDNEVECRLSEAHLIQQRIKESRELIHRLRYAVLASYYNDPGLLECSECTAESDDEERQPMSRLMAERQWESNALHQQDELVANDLSEIATTFSDTQFIVSPPDSPGGSLPFNFESSQNSINPSVVSSVTASPMASNAVTPMIGSPSLKQGVDEGQDGDSLSASDTNVSRFYITKRIIVGNTSQYLLSTTKSDPTTHKWMVYVRGPPEDGEISQFINSVWFFLHPSYAPNDIIKVTQAPFHLVRRGWGEFPIRVQLHFINPNQRPVDIIHNLKLDKTKTGQQTLGAETIVDIELERSSVEDKSKSEVKYTKTNDDNILNHALKKYISANSNLSVIECKKEIDDSLDHHKNHAVYELMDCSSNKTTDNVDGEVDVVAKPTKTGAVYHIDIPTVDPDDIVMLDHCYDHCVVVSHKPCYIIGDTLSKPSHDVAEQYMHKLVRLLPLVGEKCSSTPFTASSVEEFYKWQVGKQRAAEWMRAKSLQQLVIDQLSSVSGNHIIPSTRDIVYWCRRSGYTPLDVSTCNHCIVCGYCMDEAGSPFHVQCGDQLYNKGHLDRTVFNSISTPYKLYEDLVETEKEFIEKDYDELISEMEIDITSLSSTKNVPQHCDGYCSSKHVSESRVSSGNCQPSSVALRWVNLEASEVNVTLQPILMDGVLAHAPTHMLYAATQKFLTQLIQRSLVQLEQCDKTAASSNKDRNVTPTQVYSAIRNITEFDFLTNQYFGLSTGTS